MTSAITCALIFRLFLPLCLLPAIGLRYNGFSLVYLMFLLLLPLFPEPTINTMRGHTGRLLNALCLISFVFLLVQLGFQITFLYVPNNGTDWETALWHIGVTRLNEADPGNAIRLIAPDVWMLIGSLAFLTMCRRLASKPDRGKSSQDQPEREEDMDDAECDEESEISSEEEAESEEGDDEADKEEEPEEPKEKKPTLVEKVTLIVLGLKEMVGALVTTAGTLLVTLLLCLAGIVLPSLPSAVYFLTFLGLGSWWACRRAFSLTFFCCLCVTMAIISATHLTVLYLYQLHAIQAVLPPQHLVARLFGMSALISTNDTEPWRLQTHGTQPWPVLLNLASLLLLYYTLATVIRHLALSTQSQLVDPPDEEPECADSMSKYIDVERDLWIVETDGKKQPLIYPVSGNTIELIIPHDKPQRNNNCLPGEIFSSPMNPQHPSHSDKITEVTHSMEDYTESEILKEDGSDKPSSLVIIGQFIMKQSYICALITMMVWSITYNSWLTFALLIWSCIIWMLRDRQRYAKLSSPFLVVYGNLLVAQQFFVGLQLNEAELFPDVTNAVLIDFDLKRSYAPCVDLGAKIFYTFIFWLLLRQHLTEKEEMRTQPQASLSEVSMQETDNTQKEGELISVLGSFVKGLLVKYWMYCCGAMFFIVSFNGRVVVYKILYIVLFLFCVALYQIHYEWWRRILKYFWITVVSYSMGVLISIYAYQFKTVSGLLQQIMGISQDSLNDMGLEQYDTTELFTRILLPSAFLLACILQLHYFHEDFLSLTDSKNITPREDNTVYSYLKVQSRITILSQSIKASIEKVQLKVASNHRNDVKMSSNDTLNNLDFQDKEPNLDQEEGPKISVAAECPRPWSMVVDRVTSLLLRFLELTHKAQVLVWRLLELHIIKIVSSCIIWTTLREVSLMNYVLLILWVFALPYSSFRPLASSISTVWTCVIILCKMMYQLKFINPAEYSANCTLNGTQALVNTSSLYSGPIDPAFWFGALRKCESNVLPCLKNHLCILGLLAFEATVYRHQLYYRLHNGLKSPLTGTLFGNITRFHLDDGLMNCIRYFVNYLFYKFGMEFCFMMAVNLIGQRMDMYSGIHALWLVAVLYRRRRKAIAEIWPKYCCFMACIIVFQYLLCIGIPPVLCKDYPWRTDSSLILNLIKWLYLPDFTKRPSPLFLMYDFMLLLCASRQWQVFEDENTASVRMIAGDNVEISRSLDPATINQYNPVPNFLHCRSYLDMLKVIVFSYLFWFVLCLIFITGTTRINIFCMGYLVACFYFLLSGAELLLKPVKVILRHWDYLIGYTILVITLKNFLSIGSCVYLKLLLENHCWLVQTLGMACTIKEYELPDTESLKRGCEVPEEEAGIMWDSTCFLFLLVQRRVFLSYYFLYVVADLNTSKILAARGAELFEAKIKKGVSARLDEEKKSMEQLKKQMEQIKARQEKYQASKAKLPKPNNDSEYLLDGEQQQSEAHQPGDDKGEKKWWQPWNTHCSMIQSGSYYLFDTDSEDEGKEEEEEVVKDEAKKSSAFQLAYIALIKDSKAAVKERDKELKQLKRAQRKKEKLERRRQQGIDRADSSEDELDTSSIIDDSPAERDNLLQRGLNILTFAWMFVQALLDSLIDLLKSISKDYTDISTVLKIERTILRSELKRGKSLTQDSIYCFYNNRLSRQASSDCVEAADEEITYGRETTRSPGFRKMASSDSIFSRESSLSSCTTEGTILFSRQTTLEFLEDLEEAGSGVPKSSTRVKWKLQKTANVDLSSSTENVLPSSPTQSSCLSLWPGKRDTIEEVGDEEEDEAVMGRTPDILPTYGHVSHSLDFPTEVSSEELEQKLSETDQLVPLTPQSRLLTASDLLLNKLFHDSDLEESERFYHRLPRLLKLLFALYDTMASQSDMLCYFVIILNHIISASVLTLVLPILVFLWGMLSVPRPKKRFWMLAILYTEVTVVVKYCFQFGFFPWTTSTARVMNSDRPFYLPNIVGVEKKAGYVHYDLIQLLALFLHRSILKCHGLWDSQDDVKEKDCTENGKQTGENEEDLVHCQEETMQTINLQDELKSPGSRKGRRRASRPSGDEGGTKPPKKKSTKKRKGCRLPKLKRGLLKETVKEKMNAAKGYATVVALQVSLPIRQFFYNIIHPDYNAVCDVYVLMFLVDVINFIVIVFGYWAFGKHSAAADITESLSEDQVPQAFLVMLLIQFATMIVDRALYLRKTVLGKVVFQVILVFGIHFWMFFILPGVTERRFNQNSVAQLWYFFKCVYFGLSAYQIKCGYPNRVLGNFLTKSYNYLNLFLFQGFRMIPFLTELRAVMDWVWTDTTLSISSWICVEDIYANIFIMKCWRESEKRYPQPSGQKKNMVVKYGMGGLIIFSLICIIWFPLLFMSLIKSVAGVTNQPLDVSVEISISGYEPLFTMSAQQQNLRPFSHAEYDQLTSWYTQFPSAMQFLVNYQPEDIMVAHIKSDANLLWSISPASLKAMREEIANSTHIYIHLYWTILRNVSLTNNPEITGKNTLLCRDRDIRDGLVQLLEGTQKKPVVIQGLVPQYIRAPGGLEAKEARRLKVDVSKTENYRSLAFYRNISLRLEENPGNATSGKIKWWNVQECAGQDCSNLQLTIFSDKVSPSSLSFLAGYGIVGLYMSVVLVIGKFVREFFNGISRSIMFEELPNTDRILKLCTDIFLVRETGELGLEEQLFAKLIFLYRSPETMIKWTRESKE